MDLSEGLKVGDKLVHERPFDCLKFVHHPPRLIQLRLHRAVLMEQKSVDSYAQQEHGQQSGVEQRPQTAKLFMQRLPRGRFIHAGHRSSRYAGIFRFIHRLICRRVSDWLTPRNWF